MTYQLLTVVLVIALLLECSSNDETRRITNSDIVRGGKEQIVVNHDNFQVLYINLDKSYERREFMEKQLRFYGYDDYHRVAAVTEEDVVIPEEMVEVNNCISATASRIASLTKSEHVRTPKALNRVIIESQESRNLSSLSNMKKGHNILITALCGRPRNSIRELVVTLSHLQAIRTAIYSGSSSPYALILEDDTSIAFKIDFKKMVESAPVGFGVLQLVTSNDKSVRSLAKAYLKNAR
jgi:GR25 family glycosyltransferase involved in LPS biosynthesis